MVTVDKAAKREQTSKKFSTTNSALEFKRPTALFDCDDSCGDDDEIEK